MAVVDQRFSIDVDPSEEIMDIQMGPAHPATHGTIKFNLKLDGEVILACDTEVGYRDLSLEHDARLQTKAIRTEFSLAR